MGCFANAVEIELPLCKSSAIVCILFANTLFSTSCDKSLKMRSAETCAVKRVESWRERITTSFVLMRSNMEIFRDRKDVGALASFTEVSTNERLCNEEIATSTFTASIEPSFLAPVSSTAS